MSTNPITQKSKAIYLVLLLALTLASGCAPIAAPTPPADDAITDESSTAQPTETTIPDEESENAMPTSSSSAPGTQPAGLEQTLQVQQAKADLASRFAIAESAITFVDARLVVWPDGSMGCPQPGMMYTQVLVDGMVIWLEADGKTYQYHVGGVGEPFLCESPDPTNIPPATGGGAGS